MILGNIQHNKMALPCALFSSSTPIHKPDDFVKEILKVSELPGPSLMDDGIKGYEWSFETKYYSTTIHLCTTETRTIGSQAFADNMQAFIQIFDPNEPESFKLTQAWLPYLNHIEPVVQILVCDTSKHSDLTDRKTVLKWCVEHGFELVELSPEEDSDDEDDDFPETTGMARIVQALHAHTWSNMVFKENPSVQSPYLRQMMKEQFLINEKEKQAAGENPSSGSSLGENGEKMSSSESQSNGAKTASESAESDKGITCDASIASKISSQSVEETSELDSVDWRAFIGAEDQGDEAGVEEFEQLFKNLKLMKDKAETLPLEERKQYAEKVAVSFWKAIGGNEDEIAGLDDDSD